MHRIVTFALISNLALACSTAPERLREAHAYGDYVPGETTKADLLSSLGSPHSTEETSNGENWTYESGSSTVRFNFSSAAADDADPEDLNTVTVLEDERYVSPVGIKLGDTFAQAESRIDMVNRIEPPDRSWLADEASGTIYWFENGRVDRVVLADRVRR